MCVRVHVHLRVCVHVHVHVRVHVRVCVRVRVRVHVHVHVHGCDYVCRYVAYEPVRCLPSSKSQTSGVKLSDQMLQSSRNIHLSGR